MENNLIKPIPKFLPTIGQLPTSYLMSMSYLEQVTWICNQINQTIIPVLQEMQEEVKGIPEFEEQVNNQLEEFQEIINEYLTNLQQIIDEINAIETTLSSHSAEINSLNNKINNTRTELLNNIQENFTTLKNYVDAQDYILDQKIDNIQIGSIQVYDPTTGTLGPLQTALNNLYNITNTDGLTANEFDNLELSADDFDSYQITAYQFDSQGKTILGN